MYTLRKKLSGSGIIHPWRNVQDLLLLKMLTDMFRIIEDLPQPYFVSHPYCPLPWEII